MKAAPLVDDYDMSTYFGRFSYFVKICYPSHLITTDGQIERAKRVVGGQEPSSRRELESARLVLAGTTHPMTGDPIPAPCRMGSWAPMGTLPITGVMATARFYPTSIVATGLFQWLNQTVNASVNYCNGSALAGGPDAQQIFLQGYVGACSAAVAISMGFSAAMARLPQEHIIRRFKAYAPYPAVAGANVLNTILVRQHELKDGIEVRDADGRAVGKSKAAAWKAIMETCVTRMLIPAGNFIVAPFIFEQMERRTTILLRYSRFLIPIQAGLTCSVFLATVPICLSFYDQEGTISLESLEPDIVSKMAQPAPTQLYYHKGI